MSAHRGARHDDEAEFSRLVEPHRGELHVHAYRMLGSFEDAQDAVQDALLRAWRSRRTQRSQSSLRAWLYKITTNTCLRMLERRGRRAVPFEAHLAAEPGTRPTSALDLPWLQPYPDELLDHAIEPGNLVVARETIELAFLAAIQRLPPRQRAVLILRDVLDWSAAETAAVLETSVAAVNSALQRARRTMEEQPTADWPTSSASAAAVERSLLRRYLKAWDRSDAMALAALLTEDARMAMPPSPTWFDGRDAIELFLTNHAFAPDARRFRLVPTRANRQPAFGAYRVDETDGVPKPFAIQVLRLADGLVADVHVFIDAKLFPAFGLPAVLR